MTTAIIIDDETHAREILKEKLKALCPTIEIIGFCKNAEEGKTMIVQLKPNLVFLDIIMPEQSGFDLLKSIPQIDFEIIFVTAFDSYAINAIQFCAIGYVLKPIRDSELIQAVFNAEKKIRSKKESEKYSQLLSNLSTPESKSNKIGIPTDEGLDFVSTSEIVRCEGFQKYTYIYKVDNSKILSSYNIGVFKKLLETYGFYSTHKSHLINMDKIKKYNKEGTVIMNDGSSVPVAKRRKVEFQDRIIRL